MLKAIVEEMNRYNETAPEAMVMLNAKPEMDSGTEAYDIELIVNGTKIREELLDKKIYKCNPISTNTYIEYKQYYKGNSNDKDNYDWDWVGETFTPNDLKSIDIVEGKFVFVNAAAPR